MAVVDEEHAPAPAPAPQVQVDRPQISLKCVTAMLRLNDLRKLPREAKMEVEGRRWVKVHDLWAAKRRFRYEVPEAEFLRQICQDPFHFNVFYDTQWWVSDVPRARAR